jgi:DNA-binding response OmpR family regulator
MKTADQETVMLVDDDPSIRMSIGEYLRFHGYEVVTAESAEQAILQLDHVTPDLIILDINMPGMGGMGFLKELEDDVGELPYPVLVFSARDELAYSFARTGVERFLSKTCGPTVLLREVKRIVQKRRFAALQRNRQDDTTAFHERAVLYEEQGAVR